MEKFKGSQKTWCAEPVFVKNIRESTVTKIYTVSSNNKKIIATVNATYKSPGKYNARLIQKAPELLEALQNLLKSSYDGRGLVRDRKKAKEVVEMALKGNLPF